MARSIEKSGVSALAAAVVATGGYLAARSLVRWARRFDFAGRTVLITGGSRGLGLVMARQFATAGASVAICARDERELERAAADLESRGARAMTVCCDVTSRDQIHAMVDEVADRFGRIDVLVNNAGIINVGPASVMSDEDFDLAMKTHFWAPYHATQAVLPHMRRRGDGRIVNISSIGGKISVPHLLPYAASKFALVGYSKGLRSALAAEGIWVTTVCPGLMRTGSPRHATMKGQHRAEYAWFSISDSAPGLTLSAERAAKKILSACRHGDAELILSLPAKVAALADALFPELTADVLALANDMLPGAGDSGRESWLGSESTSKLSPSWLTLLNERAARLNNQMNG